jgi:hypothetical protein
LPVVLAVWTLGGVMNVLSAQVASIGPTGSHLPAPDSGQRSLWLCIAHIGIGRLGRKAAKKKRDPQSSSVRQAGGVSEDEALTAQNRGLRLAFPDAFSLSAQSNAKVARSIVPICGAKDRVAAPLAHGELLPRFIGVAVDRELRMVEPAHAAELKALGWQRSAPWI